MHEEVTPLIINADEGEKFKHGMIVRYLGPRENSYREIGKLYRVNLDTTYSRLIVRLLPLDGVWPGGAKVRPGAAGIRVDRPTRVEVISE